jgi:hypothetical protein
LDVFEELKQLHIDKDADYAGNEPLSNFRRCEAFGIPAWQGTLIRMSDKYARIVALMQKGEEHAVKDESLNDTLMDIAVYAVITLALRQEKP